MTFYRTQRGVSLIELMIALVLGLLVVGAAIGVFASNKQTYRATQSLGRIQENGQVAFEMLSRDIREAGATPCDVNMPPGNIAHDALSAAPNVDNNSWYMALAFPIFGFETGKAPFASTADVIQILRTGDDIRSSTADLAASDTMVTYSPGNPAFKDGEPVMICDMKVLGVFRANGASSPGATGSVSFKEGTHNKCGYFPQPNAVACSGAATAYAFPRFATISSLRGIRWFMRNGSLYRKVNGNAEEEVVQGVSDLQFRYLIDAGYVDASTLGLDANAWKNVRAVHMTMELRDSEATGTDGQPLKRTIESVVTLRNRVL